MNEDPLDALRQAWVDQTLDLRKLDEDELRRGASRLERTVRRRNAWEYLAGVVVVVSFAWTAWQTTDALVRGAAVLIVAGVLWVLATLWRKGSVAPMPADAVAQGCLTWRRQELERQRALLAGIWRWYLGPLVPGMGLLLLGSARRADGALDLAAVGATALVAVLVFAGVGRMNLAAARQLEVELAQLEQDEEV